MIKGAINHNIHFIKEFSKFLNSDFVNHVRRPKLIIFKNIKQLNTRLNHTQQNGWQIYDFDSPSPLETDVIFKNYTLKTHKSLFKITVKNKY